MLMRTFLLVVIAATSVSCSVLIPSPGSVSIGCYNSSVALDIPQVHLAESYIIKKGCENLDYDITDTATQCGKDQDDNYNCECASTFENTTAWESAVRNITSGKACYLSYSVTLTGKSSNNLDRNLVASRTNYDLHAFGGNCNTTEIRSGLESDLNAILANLEYSSLNAHSNVTGVTWTSASVYVTACGVNREATKPLIPSSNTGGTTTPPPTNTTPSGTGSGSNSNSSSSSSSSSNSTSTTTIPPVTPTPTSNSSSSSSSSSSSTGDGKGTGNGNGNGASAMIHSATAVMVAVISATVGITVITTA